MFGWQDQGTVKTRGNKMGFLLRSGKQNPEESPYFMILKQSFAVLGKMLSKATGLGYR